MTVNFNPPESGQSFKGLFLLDHSLVLLTTMKSFMFFTKMLEFVRTLKVNSIHEDAMQVQACEPFYSSSQAGKFVVSCWMTQGSMAKANLPQDKIRVVHKDDFYNGCLFPLSLDLGQQLITRDTDKLAYVYGNKVLSIVEIPDGKVLAKLEMNLLLILDDFKIIRDVELKTDFHLNRSLLIPNFSLEHLPFVVRLSARSYDLVNVITSVICPLVHVSGNNDPR